MRTVLLAGFIVLIGCAPDDDDSPPPPKTAPVATANPATSQRCQDVRADYNWRVRHAQLTGLAGSGASLIIVQKQLDEIENANWDCFH